MIEGILKENQKQISTWKSWEINYDLLCHSIWCFSKSASPFLLTDTSHFVNVNHSHSLDKPQEGITPSVTCLPPKSCSPSEVSWRTDSRIDFVKNALYKMWIYPKFLTEKWMLKPFLKIKTLKWYTASLLWEMHQKVQLLRSYNSSVFSSIQDNCPYPLHGFWR